jgi:hypothetical protein
MARISKVLAIIVLLTLIGCSNSIDNSEESNNESESESYSFTGIIKEINGSSAIVSAKVVEDNPEIDVFVNLSVNKDERFQVGDEIIVGFDGIIKESDPAQINTLSVEVIN